MNRLLLPLLLFAALALSACAPVAGFARDLLDTSDGATLSYLFRTETTLPGLLFDPGPEPAVGVVFVARGEDLSLLSPPAGAACTATPAIVDCRLGDVTELAVVFLTGRSVIASATYRRGADPRVFQTFAR